jgi:hypothetical protein
MVNATKWERAAFALPLKTFFALATRLAIGILRSCSQWSGVCALRFGFWHQPLFNSRSILITMFTKFPATVEKIIVKVQLWRCLGPWAKQQFRPLSVGRRDRHDRCGEDDLQHGRHLTDGRHRPQRRHAQRDSRYRQCAGYSRLLQLCRSGRRHNVGSGHLLAATMYRDSAGTRHATYLDNFTFAPGVSGFFVLPFMHLQIEELLTTLPSAFTQSAPDPTTGKFEIAVNRGSGEAHFGVPEPPSVTLFGQNLYIDPDGVITGTYFGPISGNPFGAITASSCGRQTASSPHSMPRPILTAVYSRSPPVLLRRRRLRDPSTTALPLNMAFCETATVG